MARPPENDDDNGRQRPHEQERVRWDSGYPPSDVTYRPNVVSLFARLGYDLYNNEDINRLSADLRFAGESRARYESLRSKRMGWIVSVAIALLGAFLTTAGQWIVNHFK